MEYGHGGDIYTYRDMLDFSVNINPLGPSGAVLEAAKRGVDQCFAYPDSRCRALREALAERIGIPSSCFCRETARRNFSSPSRPQNGRRRR